jgi:urease accessory protein
MRRAALAAAFLFIATACARAHSVIPGLGGFPGGLLHPLLVPAHVLTLIALGLLAGALPVKTRVVLLAVFIAASVGAFALIAMAFSAARAEIVMLGLGAGIGLLLAANMALPASAVATLAGAVAAALMFDSVPPVLTVSETTSSLTGTVLSAAALVAAAGIVSRALPPRIGQIAVRIAGSWIAASAIMVLALRFAA